MIRHARMQRRPALFLPGLDHASIAAQVVLDRIIAAEGESRASLGRERYLERMRAVRRRDAAHDARAAASGRRVRRLGSPPIHDGRRIGAKAVREAFARLYAEGLAYRSEALINWCPGCRTSVSDLKVVATPETGRLWTIRYHLIDESTGAPDPDAWITVATTRAGDDPRRHRRRGASRRSTATRPWWAAGPDPVRRARRPDHRRRRGGSRLRDRRRQDHPGPRHGRLRHR